MRRPGGRARAARLGSSCIPGAVLGGEPFDERGDLGADRRPSRPVRIGPLPGDTAAVPAQDGAGVTSRCIRSLAGRSRISAARTARSAQSGRGRGLARRTGRPRAAARAAPRPWRLPTARAGPASRRAGRRRGRAGGGIRMIMMPYGSCWSSLQLTGHADFWHPTGPLGELAARHPLSQGILCVARTKRSLGR